VRFLSDSRITSLQYITQDYGRYPEISNFSYGSQISSVLETSGLALGASGGVRRPCLPGPEKTPPAFSLFQASLH
jgi:hypothetical protein